MPEDQKPESSEESVVVFDKYLFRNDCRTGKVFKAQQVAAALKDGWVDNIKDLGPVEEAEVVQLVSGENVMTDSDVSTANDQIKQKYAELETRSKELDEREKLLAQNEADLAERIKAIEVAEDNVVSIDPEAGTAGDSNPVPDDLTQIKGIGPVTSERLQTNGFTTFKAVAEMDDDAMDNMEVTPEEVAQAKVLAEARTEPESA